MEEHLRRAMLLAGGDPTTFVRSPISCTLLILAALLLIVVILPAVRSGRDKVFQE